MTKQSKITGQEDKGLREIADVVRRGREIVVPVEPKPMPYLVAAEILVDKAEAERRQVDLQATFATLPYQGMIAFTRVLEKLFGFTLYKEHTVKGFFGPEKVAPTTQTVPVGPGEFVEVVWADYEIPGTSIKLRPSVSGERGVSLFALEGECVQGDRHIAQEIFDAIREEIRTNSPLAGRAFSLKMNEDEDGLELRSPDAVSYIRTDPTLRTSLILNTETLDQVETELFTPVEDYHFLKHQWGMDMNRVVLLAGFYGTGKSMTGAALANTVTENGGTYILLESVAGLKDAIHFTRVLGLPRVTIFAEDIDRIMSGDRDQGKDTVGNMISGVQSSTQELNVVVTTNDIEAIHPFMIRRFNAVVEFKLPDAEAARRLILLYGSGLVQGDLEKAPAHLAGTMPALIKDVVQTAKLSARRFRREYITDQDLMVASEQIATRARLAERKLEPEPITVALEKVGKALSNGQSELTAQLASQMEEVRQRVCR